jgi:H+-translocating NAD(P) transhydrogenase subunit alpha
MPYDASKMFGKNVLNFLKLMVSPEGFRINWDDDIIKGTCVAHKGEIISERVKALIQL